MSTYVDYGNYDGGSGGYDMGGGGGGFTRTTPDKKGGAREQSVQTVTPLSGAMLTKAQLNPQDDSITVDGKSVNKVVVCGKVTFVDNKTSYTEYHVDDSTGIIKIVKMNEDDSPESSDAIPIGSFVKVFGAVRTIEHERKVTSLNIRRVDDHNEYTCHMANVLYNHLLSTRGPLKSASSFNMSSGSGFNPIATSSSAAGFNASSSSSADAGFGMHFDGDTKRILDFISADEVTEQGPNIADVARRFGMPLDKVRGICQTLTTEGFLYSTIDDDHYKSTGSHI